MVLAMPVSDLQIAQLGFPLVSGINVGKLSRIIPFWLLHQVSIKLLLQLNRIYVWGELKIIALSCSDASANLMHFSRSACRLYQTLRS